MKITFIGAAHEVTGSCTLLTVGETHYLIDCGMEQGRDIFENVPLPIAANTIEAVFLTHAHVDHSGMLPRLYKDGFKGKIYTTAVTGDLCEIMLRDSAHIQESEAEWKNRKAQRHGGTLIEPLYTVADAEGTMRLFRRCQYGQTYQISENIRVRFTDIGHLLGSAAVELWLTEQGKTEKIVFSGDVGNINQPLINDPKAVEDTDYLVLESTYGNRLHDRRPHGDTVAELAEYISRTFDRGGSLIIPSFAVGRTQEMLYAIRQCKVRGLLDKYGNFPVYVDSPLAVEATGIFLQCDPVCFDEETTALLNAGINPIWFDGITLSVDSEQSRAINYDDRPKVIISASGMCEAGRIRHHLKHNLWKPENSVLFVGYQAENSLGRKLQDGAQIVRLFGEDVQVSAEILTLHGTSGHADQKGLLDWVTAFEKRPHTVFVNHGDEQAAETLKQLLEEQFGVTAYAPYSGSSYDLLTGQPLNVVSGVRIEKPTLAGERSNRLYSALVQAAEKLLSIAKKCRGMSNKDITAFTEQIKNLCKKWE
ncbi:MAG: MBL fold metallo-hydrolase [Clostridia bacterium]|nr:MBL fold metallo-hydrolase [Clostridia bacterium]